MNNAISILMNKLMTHGYRRLLHIPCCTLLLFGAEFSAASAQEIPFPRPSSSSSVKGVRQTPVLENPTAKFPVKSISATAAKDSVAFSAAVSTTSASKVTVTYRFAAPTYSEERQTLILPVAEELEPGTLYPVPSYSFAVQGQIVSARIVSRSGAGSLLSVSLPFSGRHLSEQPKTGNDSLDAARLSSGAAAPKTPNPNTAYPATELSWSYGGMMRGTPVSMLTLAPYTYLPASKTLRYASEMTVELTLNADLFSASQFKLGIDGAKLLSQAPPVRQSLLKSGGSLSGSLMSMNSVANGSGKSSGASTSGTVLPVQPKYRLVVRQDGIYRIGYFEFLDALLPQDFFNADPRTFRVFNKGREVPLFVRGESDAKFNRDDYMEFIGEGNRIGGKDPNRLDMYVDPYSDENVYYLYWEPLLGATNRGLRLIESSGELTKIIPRDNDYNLQRQSFRSTVHAEQDNTNNQLAGSYQGVFSNGGGVYGFSYNPEGYKKTRNQSDGRDHVFWTTVNYSQGKFFPITLPEPAQFLSGSTTKLTNDSLRLRVAMHGLSTVDSVPVQSTAVISLGAGSQTKTFGTAIWGDDSKRQDMKIFESARASGDQNDLSATGENQVQIKFDDNYGSFGRGKGANRVFFVNWIEVTYRRRYRAFKDEITFTLPTEAATKPAGRYEFWLQNFTTPDIDLYKAGVGKITNFIVESYQDLEAPGATSDKGVTRYRVIFQDDVINPEEAKYYALPSTAKLAPVRMEKVQPANFWNPSERLTDKLEYNYIIITSGQFVNETDFNSPLNEVGRYRQNRIDRLRRLSQLGLERDINPDAVLVTTAEAIYDAFNNGVKSPYAIRDFLDFAYHDWVQPPTYVLLLGDANRNYKTSFDFVPTMQVQTLELGAAASDGWYSMLDGVDRFGVLDILPDLQLSRIPAVTRADIGAYLEKLTRYESAREGALWRNTVLMIAGEAGTQSIDSQAGGFVGQLDELIGGYVNRDYLTDRLHTGVGRNIVSGTFPDPYLDRNGTGLVSKLNSPGCLVLNFMGHGGGGIWQDSGILTIEGVARLTNLDRLPFVTSMTCYTSAFDGGPPAGYAPTSVTLAEVLVTAPRGGAIGVIGSSSVGWYINDELMTHALYDFLLSDTYQGLSIADMMVRAKVRYYLLNVNTWEQAPSMVHQYNVLGDPVVRLASLSSRNGTGRTATPRLTFDLESHIAGAGDTLKIRGRVNRLPGEPPVNGAGFCYLTDQDNLDIVSQNQTPPVTAVPPFIVKGDTFFVRVPIPASPRKIINNAFRGGQVKFHIINSSRDSLARDAIGHVNFSTGAPFFRYVTPSQPISESINLPVSFRLKIDARDSLASVKVNVKVLAYDPSLRRYATEVLRTTAYPAVRQSNGEWLTAPVPAQYLQRSYQVIYYGEAQTVRSSSLAYSRNDTAVVGQVPDVAAVPEAKAGLAQTYDNPTLTFTVLNNAPVIGAEIYNWSAVTARKVTATFYLNSIDGSAAIPALKPNPVVIGSMVMDSLPAFSKGFAAVAVPANFRVSQTYGINVGVAVDTALAFDVNGSNSLSRQAELTYDLLKVEPNTAASYSFDNDVTLSYESGSFNKAGFVRVVRERNPLVLSQPDNQLTRYRSQDTLSADRFSYLIANDLDTTIALLKPMRLQLKAQPRFSGSAWAYFYNDGIQRWLKLQNQTRNATDTSVVTDVPRFSRYALMQTVDGEKPLISVGIQGQNYRNGGFAPRRPRITATVQDRNGVYLDYDFVRVMRDGVLLDDAAAKRTKLTLPLTTANANTVAVLYDDEFEPRTEPYRMKFEFFDANLNPVAADSLNFTVQSDFDVNVIGAYPNPFSDRTYIGYELRGAEGFQSFEIKIYTVAGKLINTFDDAAGKRTGFAGSWAAGPGDLTEVGRHAVSWLGTDSDDRPVANGVYYAKVRATKEGTVFEKIIKIARLR